jgi:hypothetical protein
MEESMSDNFSELTKTLSTIDFFGKAGEQMPRGAKLANAVKRAVPLLPPVYISAYGKPLEAAVPRLTTMAHADPMMVEMLAGAAYQHNPGNPIQAPLTRFLAVISNLYSSFMDNNKRANVNIPLIETLPPLAMFQHDGNNGHFTLPVNKTEELIGANVGVVSMPGTYAGHPVIWAALAHETGGHDVTHADPDLLPQLGESILAAFVEIPNKPPVSRNDLARLWNYWIDEASADVYGLLNIGPIFALNLAAFLAAWNARRTHGPPLLRMESGSDDKGLLDRHPSDIIRLHLAIGVIETLTSLSAKTRASYIGKIEDLAKMLATDDSINFIGNLPVDGGDLQPLGSVPLAIMQDAARGVGGYIATTQLRALNGHSIQDIETWDDTDEAKAEAIKTAMLQGRSRRTFGDPAQVLAGATMAVLEQPGQYDVVTQALNQELDTSFQTDPIWGMRRVNAA